MVCSFFPIANIWRSSMLATVLYTAVSLLPNIVARADDADWSTWLQQQVQQHPQLVAARERMNAGLSAADALELALFNPELETEFEREGDDDNYRFGISQTIDLWNARGARRQQAGFERIGSTQIYQLQLQQKLAEALLLLVDYDTATQQAGLAQQRETQVETLIELVARRRQAGDVGEADAALSYLSLSQQLNDTARNQARLQRVNAELRELLPELSTTSANIPDAFWNSTMPTDIDTVVDTLPSVVVAQADWQAVQQNALATRRGNKAAPTIGVNAGKEGDEDVVGLTLTLPLNLRNNFSAEARRTSQQALAAEADYLATRRQQSAELKASYAELQQLQQSYQRWQSVVADRISRSAELLEQQWRSGDLSTSEYLLALQQWADGVLAGIELRSDSRRALIHWLLQSGQLISALDSL